MVEWPWVVSGGSGRGKGSSVHSPEFQVLGEPLFFPLVEIPIKPVFETIARLRDQEKETRNARNGQ